MLVTAIRHAESLGNAGLSDDIAPGLSPRGEKQARKTAERLARDGVTHVWSSPYRRAIRTAQHIARRFDLDVLVRPDMCEHHLYDSLKDYCGRDGAEILREFRDVRLGDGFDAGKWAPPVWPETWEHLLKRTATIAKAAIETGRPFGPRAHLVVVGHGASVKGLLIALTGLSIPQDAPYVNASVSRVRLDGALPGEAILLNDAGHL